MSFQTVQEIQDKFLIRVFGDTPEHILLPVFNCQLDENGVVSILYDETHPRPYDVLNLARYYKYIMHNDEKYMKYVLKAKELKCMDAYSVITWNMMEQQKWRETINYIENDVNEIGLNEYELPITTLANLALCGKMLEDTDIIQKYTNILETIAKTNILETIAK